MANLIGQSIGRYHIIEPLGEGGMAQVYKAYDTRLEREVAVKVIRTGNIPPNQMEQLLKRFEREAKRMAKFTHPNIMPIIDYGEHEGMPYLVMPYLQGGTLKDKLNASAGKILDYRQACHILAPIARALEYAHEEETIHRDVKPANILLTAKGQPMLTDFGLAKILDLEEGHSLTGMGVGIGTPKYMAPEQWNNKVTPQTDVYALGMVLYEMVTGSLPFNADTPAGVLLKQMTEALPAPRKLNPNLPVEMERLLYKALAKEPQSRYQNMGDFAFVLEKLAGMDDIVSAQTQTRQNVKVVEEPKQLIPPEAGKAKDENQAKGEVKKPINWKLGIVVGLLSIVIVGIIVILSIIKYIKTMPNVERNIAQTQTAVTKAEIKVNSKDGAEMVNVPAGEFLMGSTQKQADAIWKKCGSSCEKEWFYAEVPQHSVYLDVYWIYKTEVTNAMFSGFVDSSKYKTEAEEAGTGWVYNTKKREFEETQGANWQHPDGPASNIEGKKNYPVVQVSWNDANAYCSWAGGRLPSEAQWEKAARGTNGMTYPWGNQEPTCSLANYGDCGGRTKEVGTLAQGASPYGAFDMVGNVWEWVNDWYDGNYYVNSTRENPAGPNTGKYRSVRGGSWNYGPRYLRASFRDRFDPSGRNYSNGFRCVR